MRALDVKSVREAASRARSLGAMLSEDASEQVAEAIQMARRAAREIVKAGEAGEVEINREALDTLARARTSFLDLDEAREVAVPTTVGRGIDLPLAASGDDEFTDDDLPDFSVGRQCATSTSTWGIEMPCDDCRGKKDRRSPNVKSRSSRTPWISSPPLWRRARSSR